MEGCVEFASHAWVLKTLQLQRGARTLLLFSTYLLSSIYGTKILCYHLFSPLLSLHFVPLLSSYSWPQYYHSYNSLAVMQSFAPANTELISSIGWWEKNNATRKRGEEAGRLPIRTRSRRRLPPFAEIWILGRESPHVKWLIKNCCCRSYNIAIAPMKQKKNASEQRYSVLSACQRSFHWGGNRWHRIFAR